MSNTIVTNGREFIAEAAKPPARYRLSIYGESLWFASGSNAVDRIPAHEYWSLYDEWAGRFVSEADAICGFPRLSGPKGEREK
jgi:hypothetical protein